MSDSPSIPQTANLNTQPKWFYSPVACHHGTLNEIRRYIPTFERRCFGLTQPGNGHSQLNKRLDLIVRLPFNSDDNFIPIGVVSKDYTLVSHDAVVDVAVKALVDANIAPGEVKMEIATTEYGERMALSIYLPDKYCFDPGDRHPMNLRLELLNSVDGSTRFRAFLMWFRLICSNGLMIGVTRSHLRRRHIGDIRLEDVGAILSLDLKEAETEKRNFERWRKTELPPDRLALWVDKKLWKQWGFKAAARTFHIAQTGADAEVIGRYKHCVPTRIAMQRTKTVPGAPERCRNLFDLSQILAWLAKERRDLQEQLQWREEIPELMKPLLN